MLHVHDHVVPLDDLDNLLVVLLERRVGVRLDEVSRQLSVVVRYRLATDPGEKK